ncbi:MAG: multiheme c-type cytochrome [Gemmatimonadales bacterium]
MSVLPRRGHVLGLILFLAGCSSSDIVYRDRAPFNPAPDVASGLLGYYTTSTKQTTCGNCHSGHQADWSTTHHAKAYSTLVASGKATATCYTCHTLTGNGNGLVGKVGWDMLPDPGYQDVQCESCHGPGTEHVKLPENKATWPLARLSLTKASASCAACHTGIHTPFAEEWASSGHAKLEAPPLANTTSNCKNCHEGRTALKAWGVSTNYSERDSATVNIATTCAVCHNPHGSANEHQLRFPINTPDPDQNLCMKCHLNRGSPTVSSSSPHGAAGYVLLGVAGYRPAGVSVDTQAVLSTHSSEANPKLCAGCHVVAFDVTDPASGATVFHSTGHSFRPLPCVDGTGKPTGLTDCAYTTTARTFKSCTASGCHGSAAVAASILGVLRSSLAIMADQIWLDTNGNKVLDAAPVDGGYLAIIKRDRPTELSTVTVITPAKGALFNVSLFGENRNGHGDGSFGVHNPVLARALLAANITELRAVYALPAPPANVNAAVQKAIGDGKVRFPAAMQQSLSMQK